MDYMNTVENNFDLNLSGNPEVYYSFPLETKEDKIKLYNIKLSPSHKLKDFINSTIKLKDVYIDICYFNKVDDKGNEYVDKCPRTILIDDIGNSYQAISKGVFNALKSIFTIFGTPDTWEKCLEIKPLLKTRMKNGQPQNVLTIEIV